MAFVQCFNETAQNQVLVQFEKTCKVNQSGKVQVRKGATPPRVAERGRCPLPDLFWTSTPTST